MKPFIIITHGATAAGKSTAAKKIAKGLETELVSSAEITQRLLPEMNSIEDYLFGTPSNEKKNEVVYGEISSQVKKLAEERKNIVVDAFFPFKEYREKMYTLENFGYDVIVLECICDDGDIIRKRLEDRVSEKDMARYPVEKARSMEVYYNWLEHIEPLDEDALPNGEPLKIIRYDTLNDKINFSNFVNDEKHSEEGLSDFKIRSILVGKEKLEERIIEYCKRAYWYLDKGDKKNAEISLKEALELNPNSMAANIGAAAFYSKLGDIEETLRYNNKLIELLKTKKIYDLPFPRFVEFISKKEYEKAIEMGELHLKECFDKPEEHSMKEVDITIHFLLEAYIGKGDYETAIQICEAMVDVGKKEPGYPFYLGAFHLNLLAKNLGSEEDKEMMKKVINHFETSLELGLNNKELYLYLTALYSIVGKITMMEESYIPSDLDPFSSPSQPLLEIYERLKIHSEIALKYYRGSEYVEGALGQALCVLGQLKEGISYLEKTEGSTYVAGPRDLSGWYIKKSNSLNKAQEFLEKRIDDIHEGDEVILTSRLELIKKVRSYNETILGEARNWMREKTKNDLSLQMHLERTLEEVIINHPYNDPAYELRVAALLHDIERAFPERLHREDFEPTEEGRRDYKRMHAMVSAIIVTQHFFEYLMKKPEYVPQPQYNDEIGLLDYTKNSCNLLIENHEYVDGFIECFNLKDSSIIEMANLLMLADTLVFFKYDFSVYLENRDLEAVKEKVNFMFDRTMHMKKPDVEVLSKVEACTKRLAEAYEEMGHKEKADELQMKAKVYFKDLVEI